MQRVFLSALVGAALSAGAVQVGSAADMPLKAPPLVAAAYSWTGCYVGIEGGGKWGRSRHDGYPPGPIQLTPYFDVSGGLVGGEVGCNYQIGRSWAVGGEFDFSWADASGSSNDTGPGGIPTFVSTTKEQWLSTARLRVGPTWDRFWVYATGGFAAASVQATLNTNLFGLPIFTETSTQYGWTAGVGGEYAFSGNWSAKLEYLYVNLDNKAFRFGNDPLVVALNAQRSGVNLENHIFRAGINYRFTSGM
jgi:outer membrane immunogenic protein